MMSSTGTSGFHIPSVDISPYIENPNGPEAAAVVDQIREACRTSGFFQLLGHGVPREVQKAAFDASARFFDLPMETKVQCKASIENGWKGYEALAGQSYSAEYKGDMKEGFMLSMDLPEGHPLRGVPGRLLTPLTPWPSKQIPDENFRAPIEAYAEAVSKLVETVLKLVAATLPYGPDVFDKMNVDPACPIRLLHYPPMPQDTDINTQLGISAHTDFSALTLLLQDDHEGLQVWDYAEGKWHGVPPNPDAYVVNIGDMMEKLTGYKSSLHRVANFSNADRYSIVYFWDGNRDYKLQPLGKEAAKAGEEKDVMTCEQYIFDRIRNSFGRFNAHDVTTRA